MEFSKTPACRRRSKASETGLLRPLDCFVTRAHRNDGGSPSILHLQRRDERLLRDLDPAELAHLLLAGLLLVEQLALAGGVAAVAFGGDVLAQGADGFAGDDLAADRQIGRALEHVRRDQVAAE